MVLSRFIVTIRLTEQSSHTHTMVAPAYPCYASKEARMKSFADWPLSNHKSPAELVDAGFFYIGVDDKTLCFFCGGGLKDWEAEDDPWFEHLKWFGTKCPLVYVKFNKKCSLYAKG